MMESVKKLLEVHSLWGRCQWF